VNNRLLALYGLKWNPFAPNVPTEALQVSARLESFCWRVWQLAGEGGFVLLTGAPGCGKSAALRILSASLATQRDVTVGVISRPQANIADFYREMGELFGVELRPFRPSPKPARGRALQLPRPWVCSPSDVRPPPAPAKTQSVMSERSSAWRRRWHGRLTTAVALGLFGCCSSHYAARPAPPMAEVSERPVT
jgi:hypothetical protein